MATQTYKNNSGRALWVSIGAGVVWLPDTDLVLSLDSLPEWSAVARAYADGFIVDTAPPISTNTVDPSASVNSADPHRSRRSR